VTQSFWDDFGKAILKGASKALGSDRTASWLRCRAGPVCELEGLDADDEVARGELAAAVAPLDQRPLGSSLAARSAHEEVATPDPQPGGGPAAVRYLRRVAEQYRAVEWLARRHAGESASIAHRAGVSEEAVLHATRAYRPFPRPTQRLGARSLPSEAQVGEREQRWIALRRSGNTATSIAKAEGTSHQLVSWATRDHGPFPAPEVRGVG
jgi:hypothetical protein